MMDALHLFIPCIISNFSSKITLYMHDMLYAIKCIIAIILYV